MFRLYYLLKYIIYDRKYIILGTSYKVPIYFFIKISARKRTYLSAFESIKTQNWPTRP